MTGGELHVNSIAAGAPKDVQEKYGQPRDEDFFKDLFKDPPALCGQTCAWLATGEGKELRGLYIGKIHNPVENTTSVDN